MAKKKSSEVLEKKQKNLRPSPSNQIFDANSNYDTPELKTVEPLLTRFVRIYPERATPAGMGLRLELLGCEIEGAKR